MRRLEEQLAGEFVVFLVEGAAGDQNANRIHEVRIQDSALYWRYLHARYALAPAGGNGRDHLRRGLPISGSKKTIGGQRAGHSHAARAGVERLVPALAVSR